MQSASSSTSPSYSPGLEASGTPDTDDHVSTNDKVAEQMESPEGGAEQALESHEVIELQAFGERKAWIVDKTKYLEGMPPIDLFAGLDAIRSSAEAIPGLPSRDELRQWLVEHDKIEKDTEAFDSGELKKFKSFTKAAAKRNLSPEDTDLIEVTLTTIYEFDKLLHLLRDRSENLDLLGTRLTWEEQRAAAWVERRRLLSDLNTFLTQRATWSSAVYDMMNRPEEPSLRRGSIASVASDSSITSTPGFSRSARFKLAEELSREAAQFASRISTLRHGRIAAAGKALDKLIDHSRKPVPEELLDEQDKLEDQGINEIENVGKFVMLVVTQWRKADELYVETMKDEAAAQSLYEEIETARTSHPSGRQGVAFINRASTIAKRVVAREDPALRGSTFPSPHHPLFPNQASRTKVIAQSLSTELAKGAALAEKAEKIAQEYQASVDAVKQVDASASVALELAATYESVLLRLQQGVVATDGDGTPPDLTSSSCLRPSQHATFLALLPSLLQESEVADSKSDGLLPKARAALLALETFAVNPEYKHRCTSAISRLAELKLEVACARQDMGERVVSLRDVRRIWSSAQSMVQEVQDLRGDIVESIERHKWKSQTIASGSLPLTPESSNSSLPLSIGPAENLAERSQTLHARFSLEVEAYFSALPRHIHPTVRAFLGDHVYALSTSMENTHQMVKILNGVQKQAMVMVDLREEMHTLQIGLEDIGDRYEALADAVLADTVSSTAADELETDLKTDAAIFQQSVQSFIDSLAQRAIFVSPEFSYTKATPPVQRNSHASSESSPAVFLDVPVALNLPVDLTQLDTLVRADCNALALTLSSDLESVKRKAVQLQLTLIGKEVELKISGVMLSVQNATRDMDSFRVTLAAASTASDPLDHLTSLGQQVSPRIVAWHSDISRSMSPIRQLLRDMETRRCDTEALDNIVTNSTKALDNAEAKFSAWQQDADSLQYSISTARKMEMERLEEVRRQLEETARLEAEERARREAEEQARLEAKERARHEAEEQARFEAQERARREAEEQARLEAEELARLEAEELARREAEEQARFEAEQRAQFEVEEKAQRLIEERTRLEAEERTRREAEQQARREAQEQARRVFEQTQRAEEQRAMEREQKARAADLSLERPENGLPQQELEPVLESQEPRDRDRELAEDIFGSTSSLAPAASILSREHVLLQNRIQGIRKRLDSLNIIGVARSGHPLPSQSAYARMASEFSDLSNEITRFPSEVSEPIVDAELRSVRKDIIESRVSLQRIQDLAKLGKSVQDCDAALSDLLEHIDSYPAPPPGPFSSSHVSVTVRPPEEQLTARLAFTKTGIDDMDEWYARVADDSRASSDRQRILQTWNELESMAFDRINGRKSRPPSAVSSGRNSRASDVQRPLLRKKSSHYSNLSAGSPSSGPGRLLAPSHPSTSIRRVVSNTDDASKSRPTSRLSAVSSNRSVSGPLFSPSSRLFNATFASRQRTTSLSSSTSSPSIQLPPTRKSLDRARPRPSAGQPERLSSPTLSEASSQSRSFGGPTRPISRSTWGRAPRLSFPSPVVKSPPRHKASPPKKRPYIANPKNKLDVAVGDIVNNLPVDIKIEVVEDAWHDQSGKYWIGGEDPKLCFCRILRSRTVMVRVGGGWMELSNFIQTHFADMFRLLPEAPVPFLGAREERWISSATLLETAENPTTPPRALRTPEPKGAPLPSFALSTPSGRSPQSLKTASSPGSPLTPLQFMRRADVDGIGLRPVTPSKAPNLRSRTIIPATPVRTPTWKP
ncbi:hypothetical protein FA95DRAFT_1552935 [Auriscalpium vulgare]|uniref:Uncharacterized protein n=1 Tax=Auriscalpium vulgare TaxID=40419 RepID=A0ACB8SAX9_9AGAM|nr:hypothetical protein FA95DRAFT_1552935 [Auriscalpium vulgare]